MVDVGSLDDDGKLLRNEILGQLKDTYGADDEGGENVFNADFGEEFNSEDDEEFNEI